MANEGNLTMKGKGITSREQAQKMGSKGGSVCSEKKKIAARLRELRKKGLTKESSRLLANMMDDADFSTLEILKNTMPLKPTVKKDSEGNIIPIDKKELAVYNKAMIDWHKLHHGSKQKVEHSGGMAIATKAYVGWSPDEWKAHEKKVEEEKEEDGSDHYAWGTDLSSPKKLPGIVIEDKPTVPLEKSNDPEEKGSEHTPGTIEK